LLFGWQGDRFMHRRQVVKGAAWRHRVVGLLPTSSFRRCRLKGSGLRVLFPLLGFLAAQPFFQHSNLCRQGGDLLLQDLFAFLSFGVKGGAEFQQFLAQTLFTLFTALEIALPVGGLLP
jgi:hypothetical protein